MKKINIEDIIITERFANSHPSPIKLEKYRNKYAITGKQGKYIILDKDNVLIDGYIQYLILKENNVQEAIYIRKKAIDGYRNKVTTYVYGKHENSSCEREFVWRVPKNWDNFDVNIGDKIFCFMKFGISPVIVTKIDELEKCPTDLRVKKVARNIVIKPNSN